MATQVPELSAVAPPSGPLQCWMESLLLGLGMPAAIWGACCLEACQMGVSELWAA